MRNKRALILVIIAAVLLGAWFFWFRHYQDRQKFEQIEVSMNELSQRIEDEFGISVSETTRYCSRESRKFEQGPLNCYISIKFNDSNITKSNLMNYVLEQSDLTMDTSGNSRFGLIVNEANCFINSDVSDMATNLSCSKRATKSHYDFIE